MCVEVQGDFSVLKHKEVICVFCRDMGGGVGGKDFCCPVKTGKDTVTYVRLYYVAAYT